MNFVAFSKKICAWTIAGVLAMSGVASQNCDGAAALLVASEQAVKDHGLKPRAASSYVGPRRQSDLDAHRPDSGHAICAEEGRHVD